MERALSGAAASEVDELDRAWLLARVADYWRALGLTDAILIADLAEACLERARRQGGRLSPDRWLRQALDEAQRRFDHALAAAMDLPPSNDPHPLAAARAALLLTPDLAVDSLFSHDESTRLLKERLAAGLPRNTPPEAPLEMKPTPLDFWLFQSTAR